MAKAAILTTVPGKHRQLSGGVQLEANDRLTRFYRWQWARTGQFDSQVFAEPSTLQTIPEAVQIGSGAKALLDSCVRVLTVAREEDRFTALVRVQTEV